MGDGVIAAVQVVVQAAEAAPHLCDELLLLIGITGRMVSPCGRGDQACEADGFGIDRREQPGGAKRRRLGAPGGSIRVEHRRRRGGADPPRGVR